MAGVYTIEEKEGGSCQVSAGGFFLEDCGVGEGKMEILERLERCFGLPRRR